MPPSSVTDNALPASPLQPIELDTDSAFQFNCHRGIACFNACCRDIDITLTPYDILRLKRRLQMTSGEFVARYTLPFEMDAHGIPGLKMATRPGSNECVHLTESGCDVYEDRPAACRYYALGNMGVRKKDSPQVEDAYFLVKEAHCLGHEEPVRQTVGEYRRQQGIEDYDDANRPWRELIIRKRSSGPTVGQPSQRSMQLFDMCSYDMDSFREFIQSDGFKALFDLQDEEYDSIIEDEDKLLQFSFRFLRQVLFGDISIPMKQSARKKRLEQRRDYLVRRREDEISRAQETLDQQKYGGSR